MPYASLEDALRNTNPVVDADIPDDPELPPGYSMWQDQHGIVHINSWRGTVYEVQEYNTTNDGVITPGNRVVKNSKLRIILASPEGFTTPEEIFMDTNARDAGAASIFGTMASSAAKTVAANAVTNVIGGIVGKAGSIIKGAVNKVKSFFNRAKAAPGQVSGELALKLGGALLGGRSGAASGSRELETTVIPDETYSEHDALQPFSVRIHSSSDPLSVVLFKVMPTVDESVTVAYDVYQPVHFPAGIHAYKGTNSRTLNLNGKFISRTPQEASRTLEFLNYIRSWTMPYHGEGTAKGPLGSMLGAPPDVLYLNAYGKYHLHEVPVLLMTYSWTYPDDIDYIASETGHPVPRIIDVSLSFVETHSPKEFESFDLNQYRGGQLQDAYQYRPNKLTQRRLRTKDPNWKGEGMVLDGKFYKTSADFEGGSGSGTNAASGAVAGIMGGATNAASGAVAGIMGSATAKAGELATFGNNPLTNAVPVGSDPKPLPKIKGPI
jgi:hypothetical protein